jgi:copper oxidase (laccase) domain-containing protein
MPPDQISRYDALSGISALRHSFLLRASEVDVEVDRDEVMTRLRPHFEDGLANLGYSPSQVATSEQVHGAKIALIDSPTGFDTPVLGCDGLVTRTAGIPLGIFVADCCAVYLADKRGRAIALVHSGKKGTELGIAPGAAAMLGELGVPPEDIVVQLSPCIRPPAYEIDFAAQIRSDCQDAGIPAEQIFDDLTCTSTDLDRFYSYRVEKGKTGRMLALMALA